MATRHDLEPMRDVEIGLDALDDALTRIGDGLAALRRSIGGLLALAATLDQLDAYLHDLHQQRTRPSSSTSTPLDEVKNDPRSALEQARSRLRGLGSASD